MIGPISSCSVSSDVWRMLTGRATVVTMEDVSTHGPGAVFSTADSVPTATTLSACTANVDSVNEGRGRPGRGPAPSHSPVVNDRGWVTMPARRPCPHVAPTGRWGTSEHAKMHAPASIGRALGGDGAKRLRNARPPVIRAVGAPGSDRRAGVTEWSGLLHLCRLARHFAPMPARASIRVYWPHAVRASP